MIKTKLRILHAYKTYLPVEGGIPTVMQAITEGLAHAMHHEVLCAGSGLRKQQDVINQISVHRLGTFGEVLSLPISPMFPFAFWKMASQFDIIDYHFPMPWIDLAVACYFPKRTKLIIHWHSDIVRQKKMAQILGPIIDRSLQRADKIVVADPANIPERLLPYREKCVVVPYGIQVDVWRKKDADDESLIACFQHQYGRFIIAVGRLVSYKGFSVLIKAMQKVQANLVIVGQGPLDEVLKQQAKELEVADRVHFLGKVNQEELKALYHAAEIFAFPSITDNEAFGMVQLEAMACNKPIVNTALKSGVPSVARHQLEALTVSPGNADEFAEALNQLLRNSELRNRLAAGAAYRVNAEFTMEGFLEKTHHLYTTI